jgi:hypothetical protein
MTPEVEDDTMHRSSRLIGAVALTVAAVALLSACGGSPLSGSAKTPSSSASASAGTGRTFGTPPAASGEIAEIDGNTLQVQNASTGQVAVTLTSKTTYTQTKAATRAAVTVGSCIVAMQPASSSSGADRPTAITATSVLVTPATNGSCSGGFGPNQGRVGGPGTVQSGAPTNRPSGLPSGGPTGTRRAFGISGLVTAVAGSTITVRAERPAQGSSTPTTYTATVTTTSATTYSETSAAHRSDVKVGLCATVTGTTNSDGTVTAKRLALTPKEADGCSTGFVRQGGGPGTTNGGSGG